MYSMMIRENFCFGGCNPFMMGGYNPRLNFYMGMALGTSCLQMPSIPLIPMIPATPVYTCSMFNPYMTINYANPYTIGGFGSFNYQVPATFNYIPQPVITNPFGSLTNISAVSSSSSSSSSGSESEDNSSVQGRKLAKRQGYGKEFLDKVKQIAKNLNCNYRDLLAVMNSESGIKADAQNKNGGAAGLIQFMPKTAQGMGTSTNELKNMTPVQQLDYVEKCIKQSKRMAGFADNEKLSGGQLYALVFLPARAKKEVLTAQGEVYYAPNKGLDANKDGKITKSELDARVKRFYVSDSSFLA